jgi:hypothetical protein
MSETTADAVARLIAQHATPDPVAAWHVIDAFMTEHYGPPDKPQPAALQAQLDKVSKAMGVIAQAIRDTDGITVTLTRLEASTLIHGARHRSQMVESDIFSRVRDALGEDV